MEGMIYTDDLVKVSKALAQKSIEYERLAEENVDDESLYGYFRGFEDAVNIARGIIDSYSSAINCEEYVKLCVRITNCSSFRYAGDCNISPDFMGSFQKGRDAGGSAATGLLWLLKPDDWWNDDKGETDEQEESDEEE